MSRRRKRWVSLEVVGSVISLTWNLNESFVGVQKGSFGSIASLSE